ncbi:ABC transporter substrate-binding protein [Virgibacillus alimentarius]|uniref:Spermidine/putrescine transport system substrate-binding protein n=1 Tax=Virgibacillus alimentarius TaxID=698769 RepID=A0ABS4SBW0_9BACI|nr:MULTISPECIES: extracellular solute-binding protein [Virgibacillus]MBP2258379.1 putative spermidine/putrescine transport system substrate-binding protein [Virgibacillus alimentarius]HLR67637.1 extracellular solute-binding protein [Virgibacillus sp.]
METFRKKRLATVLLGASMFALVACGSEETTNGSSIEDPNALSLEKIEEKAKEEGEVNSVGMPDTWANWEETWKEITDEHGIKHTDTDMSSAEEISKMESEGENATADIGDVGISFGPIVEEKDITLPYKTSYWDEIPDWAKDDDGDWVVGYQGTIAFITDKEQVKNTPTSWKDLLEGDYLVNIGDVQTGTQDQMAVLAATIAFGGDETNLQPGLDFFAEIAKQGRLSTAKSNNVAGMEKGEMEVGIMWDFNALGYADEVDREQFEVTIPEEGSVVSGYATIINKYSKHPHAAMLAREFILSDEGQINLAKGYARPIRDSVELPKEVEENMVPKEQYANAVPVSDHEAWEETAKELPKLWQSEVLVHVK